MMSSMSEAAVDAAGLSCPSSPRSDRVYLRERFGCYFTRASTEMLQGKQLRWLTHVARLNARAPQRPADERTGIECRYFSPSQVAGVNHIACRRMYQRIL